MPSCNLVDTSIDADRSYKDTVVYTYQVDLGSVVDNPKTALAMAQALGLPARRANLAGSFLFANNISGKRTKENRSVWNYDVTFGPPPDGEDEEQQNPNPLLRPPVFNVDYFEQEYVVKQARNVTALSGGFTRPAGTLGPIVNAAFFRPDEPIVRTKRIGVITIEKNFANLGLILDLNEDYQDTNNSDSVPLSTKTFVARRLKYEVTRSLGKQVENDVTFYPGVTEIAIHKTTDLIVDNVGFHYWDAVQNDYIRAKDADGNETAEPVNLKLDGTRKPTAVIGDSGPISLVYRDLEEVPYSLFFS